MDRRLDDAYRECIRLTRRSGSNFVYAFHSLPRDMHREMCVLYAFMRKTDDLGDAGTKTVAERSLSVSEWKQSLTAALSGKSSEDPILSAMADVCRRREIPPSYLFDVIAGVESDLAPHHFQTRAELERYSYLVAGAVGLCCIHIWGFRGPEPRLPAIACGNAFQLTNILRDIAEDRRAGRLYLPIEDLVRFELTPQTLLEEATRDRARQLVRFEVEQAWDYHAQARPILDLLSIPGRRIQAAFLDIYGALLREIERRDYDVFSDRIRLSRWKKLSVSVRCMLGLNVPLTTAASAQTSAPRPRPTR